MPSQPLLIEIPDQGDQAATSDAAPDQPRAPRLKEPERNQFVMDAFDLEQLIPANHLARAIWSVVQRLNSEGFLKDNKSVEGHAGRPRTSPKMLLAIWVYAYSQGMGQAREIARQMFYEPGLRWLAGNAVVSFRTLSGFRTEHGPALREMFAELLGLFASEGLVDLTELTLDGTKIKADAGADSRRRETTLREHIAQAAQVVRDLDQPEIAEQISRHQKAARKRGAEERHARLQLGLEQLQEIRKGKSKTEQAEARVSLTDPEARLMKDGHGGFGLNYNVQVQTETKNKVVVDVAVTQDGYDQHQMEPALERRKADGEMPETLIVDGGYRTVANIGKAQEQGVDLIGPPMDSSGERQTRNCAQSLKRAGIASEFGPSAFIQIEEGSALQCPAGKRLALRQTTREYQQYVSSKSDCAGCPHQPQCSPQGQRWVKVKLDQAAVKAYAEKMEDPAKRELYGKRGAVAEFPHAWWKEKFGFRRFHVRGKVKAGIEILWVALTYNMQQWIRLTGVPAAAVAQAVS